MPYTDFRKSYGDFEVVIPAVDFSALSRIDALWAVQTLRHYEYGNVCPHLQRWGLENAEKRIDEMLTGHTGDRFSPIESLIVRQFRHDKNMPSFRGHYQSGITLRKKWCEHMAKEIEREFGFIFRRNAPARLRILRHVNSARGDQAAKHDKETQS